MDFYMICTYSSKTELAIANAFIDLLKIKTFEDIHIINFKIKMYNFFNLIILNYSECSASSYKCFRRYDFPLIVTT